jgi:HAD superfamily hydrolase (TIGR01509 family)
MIKAVIFDRDGIIIDSESVHVNSVVTAFNEFGINISEDEKEWIAGRRPEDYLLVLNKKYNVTYEDVRKIQRIKFNEMIETAAIYPDTINMIKKIHQDGLLVALTTSSGLAGTIDILNKTGIKNLFQVIVTSADCINKKPDPEPYIITAKKLGVKAEECLVIEDSNPGLQSAKGAGMKCIIIYNEYTKNHDFSMADLVVKSASEINLEKLIK